MTQRELEHAVARATGEDVNEIQQRGFNLVDPIVTDFDPEPNDLPPSTVDWDSPFQGGTISPYKVA